MKYLFLLVAFSSSALAGEITRGVEEIFYDRFGTTIVSRIGASEYQVTRLDRRIEVDPILVSEPDRPFEHPFATVRRILDLDDSRLTPLPLD
jgi:hypothetical protein